MSTTSNTSGGGIGIAGILAIIFICAKVFGVAPVASWSWLWVLSPLWIGFVLVLGIWLIAITIVGLGAFIAYLFGN